MRAETGRVERRPGRVLASTLLTALVLAAAAPAALAQDATWLTNPGSGDFNTATNWTPATVPTGTAFFGSSNQNSVTFSADTTIGGWTLNAGASNYTFANGKTLTFVGAGIVVNGGSAAITNTAPGALFFFGNSTAGAATITNNNGLIFNDNSTAGAAAITNNNTLNFSNDSTAGTAVITNNFNMLFGSNGTADAASITNNFFLSFQDGSTAGAATIITTAGAAAIGTQPFQGTSFFGAATGGTSRQILTSGGLLDTTSLVVSTAALTVGSIEGSGVVAIGGTTLTVGANDLSTTFSGVIQNLGNRPGSGARAGSLVKIGAGTLTLTGANTYTGGTTFAGGVLNVGSAGALGTTGTLSFTGGTLQYSAANQTDYTARFSTAANQLYSIDTNGQNVTFATGLTSAGGSLTKLGASTLTLTGANTYTGGTTVTAGTLQAGATNTFAPSSAFTVASGATLNLAGFNQSIGSLAGAGSVVLGSATLTTGNDNTSTTFSGTISGTGALTKIGTGTTVLTATNTYSGPTSVNAGALQAGATNAFAPSSAFTVASGATLNLAGFNQSIGSLAGAGSVVLGSATLTTGNDNTSTTFSGTISGTGALTKIGTGSWTLSGTNTYSGGTALNAGTLAVGSNSALGTGDLTFANGTTLQAAANGLSLANAMTLNGTSTVDTQANALTLSGNIVGSGGLTKIGAGTLTLSGPSTYTGATNVNAGTLQAGTANAFTPLSAFTVASGATLDLAGFEQNVGSLAGAGSVMLGTATLFTGSDNTSTTFSGTISGSGGLFKIGPGTLTLSGTSTYSGPTMIAGGLINFNAASNFGTGPILLNGGGLQWAAGTSTDISSRLAAFGVGGATFDTNGNNVTLASALSGIGGVTKIGAGALVLAGTDTYTGPTTVAAGTLTVNGSIANSAVMVNSAATLSGTGTVGATTIMSGGTFAPGNSPGTMTVAGNLAFQSGALYLVQVNSTTASSTNVTGSATLAGTVQAAFASGSYATRTYTILLAAGGLGGTTFNALTTSNLPAGFTASLSYTATDATLNLTATLGQPVGPSSGPPAPSGPGALACVFSINQCNVANALNAFFNNGGALPPAFVTIFGLTGANLANALTLLSGEAATGAQQGAFQLTNQFLGVMLDPFVDGRSGVGGGGAIGFAPEREELPDDIALAYAKLLKEPPKPPSFEQRWSVWGAGYGGSNRTTGDPLVVGSHDLSARTAGGAAGLDYRLAPGTVVGFALAGGGTNWGLAQGIGGGKSDAFQAGLYGTARSGPAYLAAALAYTDHWMSTDRFAFAGDHLTASFNAQSYGGRVESGYRFATFYGGLTPYAAVQAQNFHTPGYSETDLTSGGFALGFNSRNATDTRSELGGRFDRLLLPNPEAALTMRARVAWAHDWISDPSLAALFQTLPGASFVVNGATPAKNSALTSAGAELRLANGAVLLAKFDGEFASHSSTYAGTGTVRYTW
jgi:autotransporter-associated beta strand protein